MGTCKITYNGSVLATTEETGDIAVKYNGYTIKNFSSSESGDFTITLPCKNKYMAGDLTIGSKILLCNKKIMVGDIKVDVNMPSEAIYIFDSSRSDNFLFGKYEYEMSSGIETTTNLTSWPCTYDESNTSPNEIVLIGQSSGLMKPTAGNEGYCNAVLKIKPNNSEGTRFINNVSYEGYEANKVAIPNDQALTICINAYVEKNAGSPTFAYCSSSGTVEASTTITSTSLTKYSINISALSTGYIQLSAGTGCGSLIVTDIWAE